MFGCRAGDRAVGFRERRPVCGRFVEGMVCLMFEVRVEPCVTSKDIAAMLAVSPEYVRKLADAGKFGDAAFRVGGDGPWRFRARKIMSMYHLEAVDDD